MEFKPLKNPAPECNESEFLIRQGAYLPHWRKSCAAYAVTFRLADSLPQAVIVEYKAARAQLLRSLQVSSTPPTRPELEALHKLFSEKIDKYLDAGAGACWMSKPVVAEMVSECLRHFDDTRYRLCAWCVMPNHVHVVFVPHEGFSVESILHSWKSYTAKQANKIVGRTGEFWQAEYYNHVIRDEEDLANQIRYIRRNPEAAFLKDWKWVWIKEEFRGDDGRW